MAGSSPQALSDSDIRSKLSQDLPSWKLADGAITRTYKTDGWPITLLLVNAIGFYAEAANHHPDLEVSWGSVRVELSTHSAGGITAADLALARQIERTALWRPENGSALPGTPNDFVKG